jgi:uncharacterized phage-associated protein
MNARYKALDIANVLIQAGVASKYPLSHTKLHKLLYYAQGYYMALYKKPLFDEDFQRWEFGPVCVPVYQLFKNYPNPIVAPSPSGEQFIDSPEVSRFIYVIWDKYGKYSAQFLSDMSHQEPPWIETAPMGIIPKRAIQNYFEYVLGRASKDAVRQPAATA